ncbi:hypothetical protein J6590_020716 [Homalodisca vitripennis]|nr:hypothetical protein J6590_020716 [Homalodisca vitripennis]
MIIIIYPRSHFYLSSCMQDTLWLVPEDLLQLAPRPCLPPGTAGTASNIWLAGEGLSDPRGHPISRRTGSGLSVMWRTVGI